MRRSIRKGQKSPHREGDPCIGVEELKEHQRKVSSGQMGIRIWRTEENSALEIQVWWSLDLSWFVKLRGWLRSPRWPYRLPKKMRVKENWSEP